MDLTYSLVRFETPEDNGRFSFMFVTSVETTILVTHLVSSQFAVPWTHHVLSAWNDLP